MNNRKNKDRPRWKTTRSQDRSRAVAGILLICLLAAGLLGCRAEEKAKKIVVSLDWTPNTNHSGLYVAKALGYYEEAGLQVEIQQPPEGGPELLVASGKAEFGVSFQDTIAAAWAKEEPLPVTAVAAILAHNSSGIISLKEDGIDRPKAMENKVYASWSNPIELAVLRSVVHSDGGDFDKCKIVPLEVSDVITALKSDIDAVWVFYAWDGIALWLAELETNYWQFRDIDPVFDYYSPILIAGNHFLKENPQTAKDFLKASARGYLYAMENPDKAAEILLKAAPELNPQLVLASQTWLADQYRADSPRWGYIDAARWNAFYQWLGENQLIERMIPENFGFSNDYLAAE